MPRTPWQPLRRLTRWQSANASVSLRLRQPFLFIAWLIALVWYLARPTPVAAMALFALSALLLFAYLWARQMALHLSAQRQLIYTALQVGDQLEETISLRNDSLLPALFVEFHDQSTFPDYSFSSVRAIDGLSSLAWRARALCSRRGVFSLGPWSLVTGDPFGIFEVTHTFTAAAEVLVHPPLAALPADLLPRGLMRGDERPLRQPTAARTVNAVGARPFQPGDPPRHIHWRTTARRDEPFVKVFQPEASATLWLVPDLDAAVQAGDGADSTTEVMVMLLASLAAELLRQRLAVGLFTFNGAEGLDTSAQVMLPSRGQEHFWQILRALARLQPAPGRPFAQTLEQARGLIGGRDRLLALTPSLATDWLAPLAAIHRGSQRRAEVILLDAESFKKPLPTSPSQRGGDPLPASKPPPNLPLKEEEQPPPSLPLQRGRSERGGGVIGAFVLTLAELGISARVLRKGDLAPISGVYGDLQRWEFITGGTGRAIARRAPRVARPARLAPDARWGRE